jgi:PEP-CTERM motif
LKTHTTTHPGLRSRCLFTVVLAAAALSILPGSAHAQIINPSFEDGTFNGWLTTGATSIQTSSFTAPTDGTFEALMSSSTGSVSAASLSTFFDGAAIPANGNGTATEGSGIKQTFVLSSTITLTFDYKYVTAEGISSGYDETFYFLDGVITLLADTNTAGVAAIGGLPLPYTNGRPYQTVSFSVPAGTHTLGFGSYDTGDTIVDTAILIDHIVVPEPSTWASLAMGLAGLIGFRRRRSGAAE